ncbi:MAG: hypothetical protein ABI480_04820 [Chitinophagaceae bacterium]
MTFKHTFLTWAVANLFHFLILFCLAEVTGRESHNFFGDGFEALIFMFGFLCSVPCLLFASIFLPFIISSAFSKKVRFCIWLLTVLTIVCVAIGLITGARDFFIGALAIAGTAIAIIARYKYFMDLTDSVEPNENEPDLSKENPI